MPLAGNRVRWTWATAFAPITLLATNNNFSNPRVSNAETGSPTERDLVSVASWYCVNGTTCRQSDFGTLSGGFESGIDAGPFRHAKPDQRLGLPGLRVERVCRLLGIAWSWIDAWELAHRPRSPDVGSWLALNGSTGPSRLAQGAGQPAC